MFRFVYNAYISPWHILVATTKSQIKNVSKLIEFNQVVDWLQQHENGNKPQ